MKFLTFKEGGAEKLGILSADGTGVYRLEEAGCSFADMYDLIAGMTPSLMEKLKDATGGLEPIPYENVEKCAPIPRPKQDVICLGVNYMDHAEEAARFNNDEDLGGERTYPIYFSKRVNEAVPDGGFIPSHLSIEEQLDYEAELAVIIGKEARNVSIGDAYDYVFGYTIINDVSARQIQNRHQQWYFGKSLDGFLPMGPAIITADEIPSPPRLSVRSRVNGELRQDSNTGLMIFDPAYVISELSSGMTLLPGTIISTGTPSGVGLGFDPPRFMKPGDEVECEIEKIGILRNTII